MVVVGGGVVGGACALALARLGLQVALVESHAPPHWSPAGRDLRVYAFAPDNAALLDELQVWSGVSAARAQPYRRMRVWDAAGGGELVFDADALGRRELGWIIEHGLLADHLWRALQAAGVEVHAPARLQDLAQEADGVRLGLDDGTRLDARLAIAADGADSTLRRLAGLEVEAHAYAQQGVVAYVRTAHPHEDTAWQRFLPGGPLALLPCDDGLGSIVWTLPDAEAQRVVSMEDAEFSGILTRAFDARLGEMHAVSARAAFPLRRQLVRQYRQGRVLVLGDAAHVVHPLAGQGVNLGLRDVAALRDSVTGALAKVADFATPQRLSRWARQRRSENAIAAHAFDGLNRLFSSDAVLATLLRGRMLGLAGGLPPLTRALWRRAAGV